MSSLIRTPTGHMHFVPAHKQSDDTSSDLSLTKLLVEFVLIANEDGREAYLDYSRVTTILSPVIHGVCRITMAQTICLPSA